MQQPDWSGNNVRSSAAARRSTHEPPVRTTASSNLIMPTASMSDGPSSRFRSDDSWIEISSRPSSSSLSSAAGEIITDGLRLTQSEEQRRRQQRRRLRRSVTDHDYNNMRQQHSEQRHHLSGVSSQDEDEESESESDRVMTSSNEGIHPLPASGQREAWQVRHPMSSASSENAFASNEEDDDENATAVGSLPTELAFTPLPNAFTYTPSQTASRPQSRQTQELPRSASSNSSAQTRPSMRHNPQRHSYPAQLPQHSPFNVVSPSHRVDHDAALRASLSTLLSCAAAARGLPKSGKSDTAIRRPGSNRVDVSTLRMVPESVALGNGPESTSPVKSTAAGKSSGQPVIDASEKGKRKATPATFGTAATSSAASTARSSSKDRRATKKPRRSSTIPAAPESTLYDELSPTLLTWALSAGVVVLVSALSFSAGFVVGKEVGKAEAEAAAMGLMDMASGSGFGACASDFAREGGFGGGGTGLGLRRLRWTGSGGVIQV